MVESLEELETEEMMTTQETTLNKEAVEEKNVDREWEEEKVAEKEEISRTRIRYWNKEEFGGRFKRTKKENLQSVGYFANIQYLNIFTKLVDLDNRYPVKKY